MHLCAPPRFRILVANLTGGSDPSRIGGNPVKQRMGFELQQMVVPDGTTRIAGPTQQPPAVSATDYTAAITVRSATYWDPTVAAPGPFYFQEEVRCFDQYPVASVEFGRGHGSAAGPILNIVNEMAAWINACVDGVDAVAVIDTVYMTSTRPDAFLPVQATNDTSVLLAGVVFAVKDKAGTTLNSAGRLRASFYLPKAVKSQAAPVIF